MARRAHPIHVLGPLLLGAEPEAKPQRGVEGRLLLRLVLAEGDVVSSDELVRALWGDDAGDRRAALQTAVWRLRRRLGALDGLGDVLVAERPGYRLHLAPGTTDRQVFEQLVDEASAAAAAGAQEDASTAASTALALWRGEPFVELGGDEAEATRASLDELHRVARRLVRPATPGTSPAAPTTGGDTSLPASLAVHDQAPFVGRTELVDELRSSWAVATTGLRQVVLLDGEPGVGKTRIAAAFGASVAADGGFVAYGACRRDEDLPYEPVVQTLRQALGALDTTTADALRSGPLGVLFPGSTPSAAADALGREQLPVDADAARYLLFEHVTECLRAVAREAPVLLVLDDLHAASSPTLRLLRHVVRSTALDRILVLGLVRQAAAADTGLGPDLWELLREPNVAQLSVSGLAVDDAAELLQLVGADDDHDVAALHLRTAGNPLFIREVARLGSRTTEVEVPTALHLAVADHIGAVSEPVRDLLVAASVAGAEFDVKILAAASATPLADAVDHIDAAATAGLVREGQGTPGRFSFTHSLVQEVLAASITETRRADLHLRIGRALQASGAETTAPGEVARHLTGAQPLLAPDEAARSWQQLGRLCADRLAFEDAVANFERGLEELGRDPGTAPDLERSLLLDLGIALNGTSEVTRARQVLADAAQQAIDVGDVHDLVTAALQYGGSWVRPWGEHDASTPIALLERALAELERDDDRRVRVLARLTRWQALTIGSAKRRDRADEVLAVAEASGDQRLLADTLKSRWVTLVGVDELAERIDTAARLRSLGHDLATPHLEAVGDWGLWLGNVEAGRAGFDDAGSDGLGRIAKLLPNAYHEWMAQTWEVARAVATGRFEEAEAATEMVLDLGRRSVGGPDALAIYGGQMAIMRWLQGRLDELFPLLETIDAEDATSFVTWPLAMALVHAEAGSHATAARLLTESWDPDGDRDLSWLPDQAMVAHTCALLGDVEGAARAHASLAAYADRHIMVGHAAYLGHTSYHLGVCSLTTGDLADAEEQLQTAVAQHRVMGSDPFLAHALVSLAEAHQRRGNDAEVASAVDEADEISRHLDLWRVQRAVTTLRRSG